MPVPSAISDLSTTPGLNSPSGSESPSTIDDYLRTHAAFIRQVSDSNDSSNVKLAGDQTIAGTKTFSSPIAGSITGNAATASNAALVQGFTPVQQGGGAGQGANKVYIGYGAFGKLRLQIDTTDFGEVWPMSVAGNAASASTDNQHFGIGQSWQNVSGARASGVYYTNTTSRPIMVLATANTSTSSTVEAYVDGSFIGRNIGQVGGGAFAASISFVVPPGSAYAVVLSGSAVGTWFELR